MKLYDLEAQGINSEFLQKIFVVVEGFSFLLEPSFIKLVDDKSFVNALKIFIFLLYYSDNIILRLV